MERVHNKSNQSHPDVYQRERIVLNDIQNNEKSSVNQEIQQTSGIQNCVPAECNRTSQQASEEERDQFYEEQRILENMKSNILSCNITVAEEMRKLIVSTEEQKKQVRDFLVMQESREMNVAEAKHRNEALDVELQISQKNIQELEAQLTCIQDICMGLQQHCNPVSATFEKCVQAKGDIVHYYAQIRQQIREGDELYKVQNTQLRNKAECCRQQALKEMEVRKKNKILAEKMKIEMDQKIEEVAAKIIAVQQNCAVLDDGIRQKTAKKESLVSGIMQELQEVNEKVRNAQRKNEELTAEEETLKNHIMKLEISQQEVTSDIDLLKNKILHKQQAICEAGERKQALTEEVEQVKARVVAEEAENYKHDNVLEKKMNVLGEHTIRLEQYKLEMKDINGAISELQDSCGKNQEDVKTLQEELQAEQLKQETLACEHKSEVMNMLAELELEKRKSCDINSELQSDEQTTCELLERTKDIRGLNGSVEPEREVLREDITKTRSRIAELQVQANEETEHKQKTVEELKGVETCLQELQSSLAESNKTHEEFILKVTREKCETDEELKNAEHGLQSSIVSHDCMVQETMTLVNESRQSYVQHIEMKDAALTACRNEFHSLTQQMEEASAEKDKLETKIKDEVKALEDTVNQLEEKLSKKKAENQPQAASTPLRVVLPQSEQISSSDDHKFPHSILKSPAAESVVNNKQVQFFGLSSDSDISLMDEPVLPNRRLKSGTVKRPASKHDCASYIQKRLSQELPDSPEDILKEVTTRKFFKSRSQPIVKTKTQTVQDKHNTFCIKSKK